MKDHVIDQQFWSNGKHIIRPASRDLWEQDRAIARAKMLTECHSPRMAFSARKATDQELNGNWE